MSTGTEHPLTGTLVEFLHAGKLHFGLALKEQGELVTVLEPSGQRATVKRSLIFVSHPEHRADERTFEAAFEELAKARAELATDLDLRLLWEITREQSRAYTVAELAELYFGRSSTVAEAVMWEALLSDNVYFKRRHLEFYPQPESHVERVILQQERARLRSEAVRRLETLLKEVLAGQAEVDAQTREGLVADLWSFLKNPHGRSRELSALLEQLMPDVNPLETAYELLEKLDAAPLEGRFVTVGGLPLTFSSEALKEASCSRPSSRPEIAEPAAVAIDDEETQEGDDAIAVEQLDDDTFRVRVFIALVADFVEKDSALDREAASRGATVYLPEATIRMLPDAISCDAASLLAGRKRSVLVTEAILSRSCELLKASIHPAQISVRKRLTYEQADALLLQDKGEGSEELASQLRVLYELAMRLRERRLRAGALLVQRRELKVRVRDGEIELRTIDTGSPSRQMVAEYMVLSNFVAARYAADNQIPIIYRVQPLAGSDLTIQRPRLSLYPEFHAGIGLSVYAQLSSPIRRYADLVLQRQLVAVLSGDRPVYGSEELMRVLAGAENCETVGKELERRAKRYWALRYLERHCTDRPLLAHSLRGGMSAELAELPIRGALKGAPSQIGEGLIRVAVAKVDPLRGQLTFEYLGPA